MSVDKIKERAYFMQITSHERSLNAEDGTTADEYVLTSRTQTTKVRKIQQVTSFMVQCTVITSGASKWKKVI